MPPRMIRVRNKQTGQETTVAERAFGYFAADFERLDQPQQAPPAERPAPAAAPADELASKPTVRRAAATNEKE